MKTKDIVINNIRNKANNVLANCGKHIMVLMLLFSMNNVAWGDTWNGTTTTDLTKQSHNSGNDGKTEATAWEISTAGEFAWFMKQVAAGSAVSASKTYGNKYWKLTADIDLANKEWNAYGSSTYVFLGHFDGDGHTISNMTIEPVTKKKTYSGLFGNISGTSKTVRSEVKNLTIASSSFNPTAGFSGKSCGFLCGYSRYADITNVTVTGCAFNMGDNQFSGIDHIGGVVGQTGIGVIIRNCAVTGFTLGCAAKVKALNLGGIAGYCNGGSSTPSTIEGCSVNTPTFTIGTETTINELNGCNIGGLVGSCGAGLNIYDNKVTTPQFTIYAKVTSASYIAGGIGITANYSNIDGLHISGGYIKDALTSGASDFIPITVNTEFVVAGAISKVNNGGTASGAANVVKNVAVTGMKFDLPHHNAATGVTSTNKFVVGAVMGYISDPKVDASGRCAIPENIISKGVTLYAPYAITSAVVGTSGTAAGIDNYHDDGRSDLDQLQKSQHDTWFYSDYKLGLSNDVLTNDNIIECNAATEQTAKVERNYLSSSVADNTDTDISAPKVLNMTGTTFQHKPGYSDHEFDGGTVLWWNQSGGTANDNTQQGFYPLDGTTGRLCSASCGAGGTYPYFMYFFQGVNHGTYVEPADATNIIAGIDANYTLMYKNTSLTTPTVLTISDPDGTAKKRGFDAHTISVTASDGGSYTYKWYVNGVEQSETGTSISVKPDWRYSKSIMVIATPLVGTGGATSASYTLRHGVLKTKNFENTTTDYVGMSYADRGTSENPYIIDCPEALKQWSYLSTYCTSYNYEGKESGATVAFNQSYFELGADIDLNNEELIPISHCGWSQDGTRGTINQNFVFCGHFEGNGHAIKNFKIKWKGATINSGGKYIYYGLFGALGWGDAASTQSCVVQNLILENGRIVHDNTNHSLYYEGTTHSNNVCIGMLAGLASQYTTVRNVELRNCSIDDSEDTEDYYLAGAQLTVGGMIGRIQGSITANNLDFGSTIVTKFLSSNCDITLKHAAYKSDSSTEYETNSLVRLFTVGGVIGSIYSTLAAFSTSNMPQYIYYTGKIDARRAFVAPVFASADYSGITGNNYEDYWKHFMVNATENTTQEIPNLYYGKFQIQDYSSSDDGTTQTINNSYPAKSCPTDGGSRTIVAHNNAHPNKYDFYTGNNNYFGAYQGVNYGTLVASGDRAALELEIAAAKNSIEEISSWYLVFDGDQLQLTDHMPEKLSLQDLVSGNTHTVTVINTAADADDYTYEWYINGVKSEEIANTTRSVDFTTGATPQLIYVKAIKDGNEKKTDAVDIPRSITSISASYTPVRETDIQGGKESFDGHFTVTPDAATVAAYSSNITYVWKQFKNAYQEKLEYTEETAWAANKPHILSFKDKDRKDVAEAEWTYTKSVSSDYTVVYGDTVTENITKDEYDALDDTEKDKCTFNGEIENTYSYTHVVSYTPVTVGQEYTYYHMGEYVAITDGTTYNASGTSSTTTGAKADNTYQCTVTATDDAWKIFLAASDRTSQYSEDVIAQVKKDYPTSFSDSLAVRLKKNIVVWLHPNSTDEEYGIPAGKDDWTIGTEGGDVGDKAHPVRTWGKAYSLLDGAEGVDWDFNKIVLVGTSDALTTNGFGASPGEGEHGNGTGETYSLGNVSWYGLSNVFSEGTTGLQKTSSAPSYDVYMADIARSPMAKNVTITGKYDGVDYHGAITSPQIKSYSKDICGQDEGKVVQRWFNMLGDTKFEYLTFIGCGEASYDSFFGHYHDIWFGEGLIMKNFCGDNSGYGTIATVSTPRFDIWGGAHNDERFSLYDGKNGELLRMQEKFMPHGKKGFTMTFRSGYYSIICTGSRETESVGIQGSPNMPIKCTIDVDLDQDWNNQGENPKTMSNATSTPYDVGIILSGNHEGPMFADIDINIKSGRVARVVNGSLGANTPSSYIYGNGKLSYPYNNFMGRTNIVLEPDSSRFATGGEDAVTTNARVVVTEVYNGSVGRAWADSKQEIEMASLGHFNITMNGGTIGFPHTTDYWTNDDLNKLKASDQVYCGIYGGGAGGMIGIGYGDYDDTDKTFLKPHSYTKEQFLPYWDSKDHVCPYYSPYSIYKQYIAKDNPRHLFINCYNAATDDYTEVDPADTKSVITINSGVIGSAEKPANIFGAGSGFTSTWFLRQSNYPNLTSGVVYGTSKEDIVVTLNIKGNTVVYGNVYGAGKGTDYYYTHYRTGTSVYSGDTATAKLFTFLGQTYGSAVVNISGDAVIHGNVYGGGAGVAEAKFVGSTDTYIPMTQTALLTGNTSVNISDNAQIKTYDVTTGTGDATVTNTYGGNVYGGGMLALVDGITNVNISGSALVEGSVYGGSQGIDNTTNADGSPQTISGTKEETYNLYHAEKAKMFGVFNGTINVNVSDSPTILGDIYGGSQCAVINGSTNVKFDGGTIGKSSPTADDITNRTTGGNIYGGGHGVLDTDGTTVKASADVSGTTTITIDSVKYASATIPYYIYGGGNLACSVGVNTNVTLNTGIASDQTTVYGAGYGVNTSAANSTVTINKFPANANGDETVYGITTVYGGGYKGPVTSLAKVSVNGGVVFGDVFGGGNEAPVGTAASSAIKVGEVTVDQTIPGKARDNWAEANGTSVSLDDENSYVYGNIYGGGNKAVVNGNANVNVNQGYFGGDIFGGGNGALNTDNTPDNSADVTNNTIVKLNGSIAIWTKKWDSDNRKFITWDGTTQGDNHDQFISLTQDNVPVFLVSHNVYGGGNKACKVSGSSNVQVQHGFADASLVRSKVWQESYNDNVHPHFYVFGGGYGAFTSVDTTKVKVGVEGKITEDATTDDQLAKQSTIDLDDDVNGSSNTKSSRRKTATNAGEDEASIGVYDNGYGIPGYTVLGVVGGGYAGLVKTNTYVSFGGKTCTHRIFGGGYGQLEAYNSIDDEIKDSIKVGYSYVKRKLRDVLGEVGGNTTVTVDGGYVYGDVFGGGAGVESAILGTSYTDFADMARVQGTTSTTVSKDANIYGSVYGGGDVANVGIAGSTKNYTLQPDTIKSNTTQFTSFVNIIGGSVYGAAFAGGNGRLRSECSDYTKLGRIEGNAFIHIADTPSEDSQSEANLYEPYVWNRIYGGGNYGTVDGNTRVWIEGGHIGYNIFGGGSGDEGCTTDAEGNVNADGDQPSTEVAKQKGTYANVLGNTNVQIDGGSIIWDKYANSNGDIYTWTNAKENLGTTTVDVNGVQVERSNCFVWKANGILKEKFHELNIDENFYQIDNAQFPVNHNIYGGGRYACIVGTYTDGTGKTDDTTSPDSNTGKAVITLNHSLVTDSVLLNTNLLAGACWYSVIDNTESPQFAVFGGGYGANTKVGSTEVTSQMGKGTAGATDNYAYYDADYKAWNKYEQNMYDDYNALDDASRKALYGGESTTSSSFAYMYRRYRASRYAWSSGIPSATYLHYFGGGFSGYVTDDTSVKFTDHSAVRHVFGGGLGAVTGRSVRSIASDAFDGNTTFGQVGGNTTVNVESSVVSANVYGGGGGVESSINGTDTVDFVNMARVLGKTSVTIDNGTLVKHTFDGENSQEVYLDNTVVFGHVYGGGDVANVYGGHLNTDGTITETGKAELTSASDFASDVFIKAGTILSQIHGGGSGRKSYECKDYTQLGAIYGNTHVHVGYDGQNQNYYPWLLNRVYGGGECGTVYGNTLVDIINGNLGYNTFGGGWGDVDSTAVGTPDAPVLTSADVKGNTYVNVTGGEAILAMMWDGGITRAWLPVNTYNGKTYSAQYDPITTKFKINHNIYGGGNAVCEVGGDTHVNIKHGLLSETVDLNHDVDGNNFFLSNEWKEVYNKVASPHFAIFGGGFGENTKIDGNTYVDVNMPGDDLKAEESESATDVVKSDLSGVFKSNQSVMDVIGGGYSGTVVGATNVTVGGSTYARRILGGGFYAPVGSTNVTIKSINCDDVFGGGLMGNVGALNGNDENGNVNVNIGASGATNDQIFINKSVYGGNDVSGTIYKTATINAYGGKIYGNVYGAGNGNYLYAQGVDGEQRVTVNEGYVTPAGNTEPLVYTVPVRSFMTNVRNATAPQRMVSINSYRPQVQFVKINLTGADNSWLKIIGNVFGGGNSATVNPVSEDPTVNLNFGSCMKIGGVYLGCDGDAMFDNTNNYLQKFQEINKIELRDAINWQTNPNNIAIPEKYLPVSAGNRPKVYAHNLDLYFQPVEMSLQPTVTWTEGMHDVTIGSFICGGNRGNMNVEPDASTGKIVDIEFPEGLTILNRIVGGCNNANYTLPKTNTSSAVTHEGGYLLGSRTNPNSEINIVVNCHFDPLNGASEVKEGGNVYGGCYKSGTIKGDTYVDVRSNMLENITDEQLSTAKSDGIALANVYGAGYGTQSYVYGKANVYFGNGVKNSSANYIFGGGQQGNLIGNSLVRVYNGHVASSICGGSYAGNMWGSTQVLVGYPKYYTAKNSAAYDLLRTDKWNSANELVKNADNTEVIKTKDYIMAGDIVSEEVYDAILAKNSGKASEFTEVTTSPSDCGLEWSDIDINIDDAVFGGGYSLSSGSSQAAGTNTVLKYDEDVNLNNDGYSFDTKEYGGNTTVLVWDAPTSDKTYTTDHITISSKTMQVANIADGTDLHDYYYKDKNDTYHHISQSDKYYKGGTMPADAKENDYTVYENTGEGGLYGDGHLSFAEGFRCGEMYGYGFASSTPSTARMINTFQRMDMLRLTDCCISLLGARDYTAGQISTVQYSIARIGELQMLAKNVTGCSYNNGELENSGSLAAMTEKRSRNYLAFNNNIHYCGAVYSNVAFNSDYRGNAGKVEAAGTSYRTKKQKYISEYCEATEKTAVEENKFQKRNIATAANCIGIASGYALKLQNLYTDNTGKENIYYGPIVGVAEIDLINIQQGEGGGYVYADNIHHRNSSNAASAKRKSIANDIEDVPVDVEGKEDFLETSGNFVFQFDKSDPRYIVDDCFPTEYYEKNSSGKGTAENSLEEGIHYWYVTGYDYYYNVQITGYTYDSANSPLTFVSNKELDADVRFTGLQIGQAVNLRSMGWHSGHVADSDGFVQCDLEGAPTNEGQAGNTVQTMADGHYTYDHYNLSLSTVDADGNYYTDNAAYWKNLPLTAGLDSDTKRALTNIVQKASPEICFNLTDGANNSGADYYTKYMNQPCKATLVFTAPGQDKNQRAVYDYMPITNFYTRSGSEGSYRYDKVVSGHLNTGTTYYYMDNIGGYSELTFTDGESINGVYVRGVDDDNNVSYNQKMDATEIDVAESYYTLAPRNYKYTIYLTIDYMQGPSYTGSLKVYNCALPGEMIKVDKGSIQVTSDQQLPQSATYWRIGKVVKGNDGRLTLADDYYQYDQSSPWSSDNTHTEGGKIVDDNTTSKMLKDVVYNEDDNYILVPAYYFMNGYGVEYCFKVYGLDGTFPVQMVDDNVLTIHNYHRMQPRSASTDAYPLDLHIDLAAQRHKSELDAANSETDATKKAAALAAVLPEPRIYMSDATDMSAFANSIKEKDSGIYPLLGADPDYGANMQFFVQSDITLSSDYKGPSGFKGTLNGNGHVFTVSSTSSKYLLESTDETANIYNLGMKSGVITDGDNTTDTKAGYHCCYTYGNNVVYRMDGTPYTDYDKNDWRYGKVAYDLNQYYLDSRYARAASGSSDPGNSSYAGKSSAAKYVENLYANGDYLYADFSKSGNYNGSEFLRTESRPNYGGTELVQDGDVWRADTKHDVKHTIDKSRAVGYVAAIADDPESCTGYQPLFDALCITDGLVTDQSLKKNDYIFFGQLQNSSTKKAAAGTVNTSIPDAITATPSSATAYHLVSGMTNRMYRAGGYYRSTNNNGYYYNASAYVHSNDITAIDFYGYDSQSYDNKMVVGGSVASAENGGLDFYAPVSDYGLTSISTDNGVTRNLLLYARNTSSNEGETDDRTGVLGAYNYTQSTDESKIKAHVIDHAATPYSALFHLVERATESDANNDFCCPVAFNVTTRAWYTRKPAYYAEESNTSWEGLCLPFSVNKVEADYNGEITHFYGADNAKAGNDANTTNTGHEYWLRGMTSVTDAEGVAKATFLRPGAGLFSVTNDVIDDYKYKNTHFKDVYGDVYATGDIYASERTYASYYFQRQGVPYIVSFPGTLYREFDLSGGYNSQLMNGNHSNDWDADKTGSHEYSNLSTTEQNVTFSWYCTNNTVMKANGTISVPKTGEMKTVVSNYNHTGTFLAIDDASYGMGENGTEFNDDVNSVLPFRTYMVSTSSSAKAHRISIAGDKGVEEMPLESTAEINGLRIYSKNHCIIVESNYATTLSVYTTAGQLVRVLDVTPGVNTYSGFAQSIYLVGQQKLYVK